MNKLFQPEALDPLDLKDRAVRSAANEHLPQPDGQEQGDGQIRSLGLQKTRTGRLFPTISAWMRPSESMRVSRCWMKNRSGNSPLRGGR